MRRNKSDTAASRDRIVSEASQMVRRYGPEGVSVAEIMAAAGMTHGGFYNHFSSKADLLGAAVDAAFSEKLGGREGKSPPERRNSLIGYIDSYLSRDHVDHLATGCPIAGLAPDAARLSPEMAAAMAKGAVHTLETFEEDLGLKSKAAIELLASMIGTIVLARAVSDPALSAKIVETMRASHPARDVLHKS